MEDDQNLGSDESISSGPCMDSHLNLNNIQNHHETTSANSSNVSFKFQELTIIVIYQILEINLVSHLFIQFNIPQN